MSHVDSFTSYRKTSDELLTSDEDEIVESSFANASTPEVHTTRKSRPRKSVVVEDSSDDEEYIIKARPRNRKIMSESEDDEKSRNDKTGDEEKSENDETSDDSEQSEVEDTDDDNEFIEREALSPRTRMSITGHRPKDFTDDESDIISDKSDEDKTKDDDEKSENDETSDDSEQSEVEDTDDDNEFIEREALSPRTRMSITGHRPKDFTDDESDIVSDKSDEVTETPAEQIFTDDEIELHDYNPEGIITNASTPLAQHKKANSASNEISTTPNTTDDSKSRKTKSIDSQRHNDSYRLNLTNPGNSKRQTTARISDNFDSSIANKFSSTIAAMTPKQTNDTSKNHSNIPEIILESPPICNSSEGSVQITSLKNDTIEISSGSDSSVQKLETTPAKKVNYVQPKISQMVMPVNSLQGTKVVSEEYLRQQMKKLEELRSDLAVCENLIGTVGSKLPDKGKRMSGRTEKLRVDIRELAEHISTLVIDQGMQKEKKPFSNINPQAPTWEELTAAANSIQPKYTGKIGLATFTAQKTLTIDRLKDLHGSLETCPDETVLAEEPKGLKISLMKHQRHALAWMYWREKQKPRGGILADDMGLGKTLTMISLVLASLQRNDESNAKDDEISSDDDSVKENNGWSAKGRKDYYDGGTLVICPASLIRQWESEVETRTKRNSLTVCVHHGNYRETRARHLAKYDMVVTTYNIIPREMKSNGPLFGIKWNRIILDEAHIVRNHKSQASMSVCKLKGKYRWTLTGTPIQNKEMDLYALLKFLKCSPFDELPHWKKWIDNKSAGGQQRLNTLMKSLMLRRTKVQLQENGSLMCLPEKDCHLIEVTLDKEEMNVYQKIMIFSRTLFAQFLYQRAERNNDYMYTAEGNKPTFLQKNDPNCAYYKMHQKVSRLHGDKEVKSHEILVLLLRLRQICCHPGLIDSMLEDEDNSSHIEGVDSDDIQPEIDLLDQLNKMQITDENKSASVLTDSLNGSQEHALSKAFSKVLLKSNPVFNMNRPSSKIKKIIDLLTEKILKTDDKAIVVSQWTSVLNILKTHLAAKHIPVTSLDGSVAVKYRNDIVKEFNNPNSRTKILLLSLTAGGVGLNLVGANHLLLMDLHWNPQLEAQAQDRIYRVGQTKFVHIYKFMCKDTVEQHIKALQDHKLAIANGVLTGVKSNEGSKLSMDDLKTLFGL